VAVEAASAIARIYPISEAAEHLLETDLMPPPGES
jgi:hypothetical protein